MGCGGSKLEAGAGTAAAAPAAIAQAPAAAAPVAAPAAAAAAAAPAAASEEEEAEELFGGGGAVGADDDDDDEDQGETGDSFPEDVDPAASFPSPAAKPRISLIPVTKGEVGREEIAAKLASRISMAAISGGIVGGANKDLKTYE